MSTLVKWFTTLSCRLLLPYLICILCVQIVCSATVVSTTCNTIMHMMGMALLHCFHACLIDSFIHSLIDTVSHADVQWINKSNYNDTINKQDEWTNLTMILKSGHSRVTRKQLPNTASVFLTRSAKESAHMYVFCSDVTTSHYNYRRREWCIHRVQ